MIFKQFYLACLAHASYLIGSDGEAIVVDPQRDVDEYITAAEEAGLRICYIFETHVHADFVSGHRELAERTGAEIVFGPGSGATLDHRAVRDGDRFRVGSVLITVLETPGHTPESISLLVSDADEPSHVSKVLSGDTLFIGDVGRPDLAGSEGYSAQQMAATLYESLHSKLLTLDDSVEVYPAHGAGSLCGRNISKETSSTIGIQRATNHALQPMSKDAFVRLMTTRLPDAPAYFSYDAALNRGGLPALDSIAHPEAITCTDMVELFCQGTVLLDVRPSEIYGPEHIFGSINIGLDGQFASWAGALIPLKANIVLIADENADVAEAVKRLARVGISSVIGYLQGGLAAWKAEGRATIGITQMPVVELGALMQCGGDITLLDVRRQGEFEAGSVSNAVSMPLDQLESSLWQLDRERTMVVICGSGYRSSIATSILELHGFVNPVNVDGGMTAYTANVFKLADVAPHALLAALAESLSANK